MIKYVFFDLDGTVLPMDQDRFIKLYFGALAKKLAPLGYSAEQVVAAIWKGTKAMLANDGACINEELFWKTFRGLLGDDVDLAIPLIDEFYKNEFFAAREACGCDPTMREVLDLLRKRGIILVLATNPVFPAVASETRMQWGGARPDDFAYITTYSNSRFCKPNPNYYRDIIDRLGAEAEECLMVGNDVCDDMPASEVGCRVFLLTDCLLNPKGEDISAYPHGSCRELLEFLKSELCR